VLEGGGPVLIVPETWPDGTLGRRVLVGWNGSREARRAAADALPLLRRAERVTVLSVAPDQPADEPPEQPGAELAHWLARHGVPLEIATAPAAGVDPGAVLLARAAELGCDLLVMGAYGHSRLRERVLGGATRTVLGRARLPVLMAS